MLHIFFQNLCSYVRFSSQDRQHKYDVQDCLRNDDKVMLTLWPYFDSITSLTVTLSVQADAHFERSDVFFLSLSRIPVAQELDLYTRSGNSDYMLNTTVTNGSDSNYPTRR